MRRATDEQVRFDELAHRGVERRLGRPRSPRHDRPRGADDRRGRDGSRRGRARRRRDRRGDRRGRRPARARRPAHLRRRRHVRAARRSSTPSSASRRSPSRRGSSSPSSPAAPRAPPRHRSTPRTTSDAGAAEIAAVEVGPLDAVVGLSASGRTPYVIGALDAARSAGALTVALVAVPESELGRLVDHEIAVVVGPEVIAGSTRLKAGTAQKLVLNMISTIAMVRLGKTYGNLMVDVVATNDKLRARVHRIVAQATWRRAGAGRRGARRLPAATRRSRSSRCSPASTPTRPRRAARRRRTASSGRRSSNEARRRRRASSTAGSCPATSRSRTASSSRSASKAAAAASRSRASSTCR